MHDRIRFRAVEPIAYSRGANGSRNTFRRTSAGKFFCQLGTPRISFVPFGGKKTKENSWVFGDYWHSAAHFSWARQKSCEKWLISRGTKNTNKIHRALPPWGSNREFFGPAGLKTTMNPPENGRFASSAPPKRRFLTNPFRGGKGYPVGDASAKYPDLKYHKKKSKKTPNVNNFAHPPELACAALCPAQLAGLRATLFCQNLGPSRSAAASATPKKGSTPDPTQLR